MSYIVCPTITVSTIEDYRAQLDRISFAPRIHIDLADGLFASPKSVRPEQVYWSEDQSADIHVMMQDPYAHIETLLTKQPHTIILHAESETFAKTFDELTQFNIPLGISLLPGTQPNQVADRLKKASHCLIFGGNLGHQGGEADLSQLAKVEEIRAINLDIEISWDGGASLDNIHKLTSSGIDVVNAGGAIHYAENPEDAYDKLLTA